MTKTENKVNIGICERGEDITGSSLYSIVAIIGGELQKEYVLAPYYRAYRFLPIGPDGFPMREDLAAKLYRETKDLPVFCTAKRQLKKAIETYLDLIDAEAERNEKDNIVMNQSN